MEPTQPELSFPESLMVTPDPATMNVGREIDHNRAVSDFQKARMGAVNDLRRVERGILDLLAGIDQYVSSCAEMDEWTKEYVFEPMLTAAHNALNLETGRLLGSVLSAELVRQGRRIGVEL